MQSNRFDNSAITVREKYSSLPFLQIPIQEKDSGALQTIAEEIQLFQKVQHENIVKFYGVEIHHVR